MGNIRKLTNEDPDFYQLMGPFLSRREIVKELGFPVWDEDGKTWYLYLGTQGDVQGFAATRPESKGTLFCSAYVLPKHRKQRIYEALILARLTDNPGVCLTTATQASRRSLERHGFTAVKKIGSYTRMRREVL